MRPYLLLRIGGFECSLRHRPTGRTVAAAAAALLPGITVVAALVRLLR